MDTARIAALLAPFVEQPLSPFQLDQISIYIDLLKRWNARINLTAIRHEEEIVTRHFGESFFMARALFPNSQGDNSQRVVDIGSGAGFPALPLKLWAPEIHLTLIESNNKKATFLKEVARSLTLTNINVIPERLESIIAAGAHPHPDVVTLRAVERFESIVQQAAKLLAPGSTLALLISSPQLSHLKTLENVHWKDPIPVPESKTRLLAIGVQE